MGPEEVDDGPPVAGGKVVEMCAFGKTGVRVVLLDTIGSGR